MLGRLKFMPRAMGRQTSECCKQEETGQIRSTERWFRQQWEGTLELMTLEQEAIFLANPSSHL